LEAIEIPLIVPAGQLLGGIVYKTRKNFIISRSAWRPGNVQSVFSANPYLEGGYRQ
jgi:hypothetical protein